LPLQAAVALFYAANMLNTHEDLHALQCHGALGWAMKWSHWLIEGNKIKIITWTYIVITSRGCTDISVLCSKHVEYTWRPSCSAVHLDGLWNGLTDWLKGIKHSDIQVMSCEHVIFYMHLHNLTCNQNCYIHYMSSTIFTTIYMTITYSLHAHYMACNDHVITCQILWLHGHYTQLHAHVISCNYKKHFDLHVIACNACNSV